MAPDDFDLLDYKGWTPIFQEQNIRIYILYHDIPSQITNGNSFLFIKKLTEYILINVIYYYIIIRVNKNR